jgi:hypothetical protein
VCKFITEIQPHGTALTTADASRCMVNILNARPSNKQELLPLNYKLHKKDGPMAIFKINIETKNLITGANEIIEY